MTFVLAHLSDPHLGPLPRARRRDLANKRLLGWLNWQRGRGDRHLPDTLRLLLADVAAHDPDHVAVTGDLVNIALEAEFAAAAAWLAALGTPADVTVVPGNHDAYVGEAALHALAHWGRYMTGDDAGLPAFPFVRRRGPIALVGVSTAVPTAPFLATGRVGRAQREALAAVLAELGRERVCRVVLIHHPPAGEIAYHKRLTDAPALLLLLRRFGAELVLHGHTHVPSLVQVTGPAGPIPIVGVGSASAGPETDIPASWNRITVEEAAGGFRIALERRGYPPGGSEVATLARAVLSGEA